MGLFGSIGKVLKSPTDPLGQFNSSGDVLDMVPGIGDARAQERANEENKQQAALNRAFQERMSNTAYQRAMEDMRKSGLNPVLAYMQGGASSPSGSTAQVESASKTGLADFALKATTGVGGLQQQATAARQQQIMNESAVQLNATQAAKNVADAQRIQQETKGLGRQAAEGELWEKLYKGINKTLDSSAKDINKRGLIDFLRGPEKKKDIKVLGPYDGPLIKNQKPQ